MKGVCNNFEVALDYARSALELVSQQSAIFLPIKGSEKRLFRWIRDNSHRVCHTNERKMNTAFPFAHVC